MTVHDFRLPDIGEGLTQVQILHWLVPVGGHVATDEALVEVETDKAVTEIPSPHAGTVIHHGAAEGDAVPVGDTLAVIGEPGDTWPPRDAAPTQVGTDAAPIVGSLVEEAQVLTPLTAPGTGHAERPAALPLVRKLAKQLGVDLRRVAGTGANGTITRRDVEQAAASAAARETTARETTARDTTAARDATGQDTSDERRPLSPLRKAIAASMSRSWAEIPHVTAFDEVDATRLLQVRTSLQARHEIKIPVDALVVAAVVPALRAVPAFNASLTGDELVIHHRHDIGIAVDTPDGLLVVVLRDAGNLGLLELSAEIGRLGERARARTLTPSETTGQTFTISNIGAAGGSFGTPLVPPGTVGILSVGRAREQPVVQDGRIEIAPVMPLSLSYDHRVADGAVGRRFLALLVQNLTEPALLLA